MRRSLSYQRAKSSPAWEVIKARIFFRRKKKIPECLCRYRVVPAERRWSRSSAFRVSPSTLRPSAAAYFTVSCQRDETKIRVATRGILPRSSERPRWYRVTTSDNRVRLIAETSSRNTRECVRKQIDVRRSVNLAFVRGAVHLICRSPWEAARLVNLNYCGKYRGRDKIIWRNAYLFAYDILMPLMY